MLTRLEQAKTSWGGVSDSIDAWLEYRGALLVRYCKLAGLSPFEKDKSTLPTGQDVASFCNDLLDYVSTGHFKVFDKLEAFYAEQGEAQHQMALARFEEIGKTTDLALNFNDRYSSGENDLMELDKDLNALGQALMTRFELEDMYIAEVFASKQVSEPQPSSE